MTALVLRSTARRRPLTDSSVDLIVTSPPYFALRSYQDGGEHYAGQVGDEATPAEFLDSLLACTAEWLRVLKPTGSLWVNLGDKYAGGGGQWDKDERPDPQKRRAASGSIGSGGKTFGFRPKSLMGIPWRYALRCVDERGLVLRAEVIWSKPNGLPESVTDRVRRSHEQWFHFTQEPRYFSAVDEVREPHDRAIYGRQSTGRAFEAIRNGDRNDNAAHLDGHPLGKLPGSVWTIPTQPLTVPPSLGVDHFAAFPMEWPRRIIKGWSPSGICTACGEGRRPVAVTDLGTKERDTPAYSDHGVNGSARHGQGRSTLGSRGTSAVITGEACGCPTPIAPTRPAVVLDPFGGTGTTALVASSLGRTGISVDLSHDYSRLARWRTTDPGERARAMQVEKPPVQMDGQFDLFGGAA